MNFGNWGTIALVFVAWATSGCTQSNGRDQSVTGPGGITTGVTTSTSGDGDGDGDGDNDGDGDGDGDGDEDSGGDGDGDDDGGIKFDTQSGDVGKGGGGDGKQGCKKVDFMFVIDNSGSMQDEQQNLINSFPGFIDEIQNTLMAQDYQILVTDTDAGGAGGCFQSTCCNANCQQWCQQCQQQGCNCQCNNAPCPAMPSDDCDEVLGAGKTKSSGGNDCGIVGGSRFMTQAQPNLEDTFACAALVGTGGDGNERPMQSVMDGITDLNAAMECNEGFLRDDAILVVTVITDEEDLMKSDGNPADWYQTVTAAKGGDEKAVVALALVGDTDVNNGLCDPYDNGGNGAEGAPRLRQWAESYTHGLWGSVCADDYAPFFSEAVMKIDTACDEFVPEG